MHACQVHPVMNRTLVPYRQGTVGPSVGNSPASRYAYRFDTLSSWSAAPLRHRRQQQSCLFPRAAELGGLQAFPVYPHQKIPFCRSSPLSAGPPTSLCSEITLSRSGVARLAGYRHGGVIDPCGRPLSVPLLFLATGQNRSTNSTEYEQYLSTKLRTENQEVLKIRSHT